MILCVAKAQRQYKSNTVRISFLGFHRLMKALRDHSDAEVQQPYAGRCTGEPREKPGPFYCQASISFSLSLLTALSAC